jgi:hypothetical protein
VRRPPRYHTDAAHPRPLGLPSAEARHEKVVEVLKALTSYHQSYRAAISNDKRARLPLLRAPTLAACARTDMPARMFDEFAALIPRAERALKPGIATEEALAGTVTIFIRFLDAPD